MLFKSLVFFVVSPNDNPWAFWCPTVVSDPMFRISNLNIFLFFFFSCDSSIYIFSFHFSPFREKKMFYLYLKNYTVLLKNENKNILKILIIETHKIWIICKKTQWRYKV